MMDCRNGINFNTEMSGERDIEDSFHSNEEEEEEEEEDTCIEITPAAEKTPRKTDLNTVNKPSKQSGTTSSKQQNRE